VLTGTEIAEFRHVREGLADLVRSGGSVEIRDETLMSLAPADVMGTLAELGRLADQRGMRLFVDRIPDRYVTVVRWAPDDRLPADPEPDPLPHPITDHRPVADELRSSGWSS
jgi:hypothetical protein